MSEVNNDGGNDTLFAGTKRNLANLYNLKGQCLQELRGEISQMNEKLNSIILDTKMARAIATFLETDDMVPVKRVLFSPELHPKTFEMTIVT